MTPGRRYVLITPCRDEARYARRTLESVAAQTVRPDLWVVVDDGSSDQTPQILAEYAQKLPFLRVIRRADRGFRQLGGLGQALLQVVWIELREALVEDDEVGPMEERSRHADAAAFAVRELPARFADQSEQPS